MYKGLGVHHVGIRVKNLRVRFLRNFLNTRIQYFVSKCDTASGINGSADAKEEQ